MEEITDERGLCKNEEMALVATICILHSSTHTREDYGGEKGSDL